TVVCPTGKKVVSGGIAENQDSLTNHWIAQSYPLAGDTSWTVTGYRLAKAGIDSTTMTAWALCVGRQYWVDEATGSDANSGTKAHPWQHLIRADTVVKPGEIVMVKSGTYTGNATSVFTATAKGTKSHPVTYKSAVLYGAVLDGQSNFTETGIVV